MGTVSYIPVLRKQPDQLRSFPQDGSRDVIETTMQPTRRAGGLAPAAPSSSIDPAVLWALGNELDDWHVGDEPFITGSDFQRIDYAMQANCPAEQLRVFG